MNKQHNWDTFISLGYGQKSVFKKNKVLFHQGEAGKGFYYLIEGEVKISVISNEGHERDIDYVTPGELIGVQGLKNDPYTYTAKTTDLSTVYFFSNQTLNQLIADIPEASNTFIDSLITKVQLLAETISLLNAPAEYRLAHFLYKIHLKTNKSTIRISQTSLSRYIGTSRITVYKIFKQLEQDRVLEFKNREIELLDINKLKTFLNSFLQLSPEQDTEQPLEAMNNKNTPIRKI